MTRLYLTCKEVARLVVAREDRPLPLTNRIAIGIHMKICDTCPVFERQVITMRNAFQRWRNYIETDVGGESGPY